MILMNDFKAEPEELRQQEITATERVLKSGWFIFGEEVQKFETAWANFCGAQFGVGVGNGMDAIEIGLRALDIGPSDEVITTPTTAMATILAIAHAGATPVLADIDPDTALLDAASVERCITPRTKAVLLVHLFGQLRDMEKWAALCKKFKIHLLEDCAQAHGAIWNRKVAGTFGTWGAYSFYPTKNLGAKGDAGVLITNSEGIAERAKAIRNYGQAERYRHTEIGVNSRLDELQAAILNARLCWLEKFNLRRREIAEIYSREIRNPLLKLLSLPLHSENHVHHLFVLRTSERDRLQKFLRDKKVETLIHYPIPAHRQPWKLVCRHDPNGLPCAEAFANECLSVPCHPQMSDGDAQQVIGALNEFQNNKL